MKKTKKQVLVLIDWDNLFYSLSQDFRPGKIQVAKRLKCLKEWILENIGEIFGGYGFLFVPEYCDYYIKRIAQELNLKIIVCPKTLEKNEWGELKNQDVVDENIIWFGKIMLKHPDIGYLCLVSGDNDFVPLFEEASKYGIKRMLAPPTINSLARSKELIFLTDKYPVESKKNNNKKMIFRMDEVEI